MVVGVAVVLAEGVPVLGFGQRLELAGSSYCGVVRVVVVVGTEVFGLGVWDTVMSLQSNSTRIP